MMGRISDLDIDRQNVEAEWLYVLSMLFQRLGYEVALEPSINPQQASAERFRADMELSNGEKILVELKVHRSPRVPVALIRNAVVQLDQMLDAANAQKGILIIPQPLVESHYNAVRSQRQELWDANRLISEASPHPDIAAHIIELLRELRLGAELAPEASGLFDAALDTSRELPPLGEGGKLADELEKTDPGNKLGSAKQFERVCELALKLLFNDSFLGWRSQSAIEQGYQRVDVIARLQPAQSAFWSTLSQDFRSRYVVFEFKNYSDPITQDQVYSTEKYLFVSALRSIAVMIARNGAADSAMRAIQGALREQGKLILCLSMSEFCDLLRNFDKGDSPEGFLITKVDDLLTTIGR
jgi:Restriction endonuclease